MKQTKETPSGHTLSVLFRYAALMALTALSLVGLLSEPSPSLDAPRWWTALAVTKSIGLLSGYALLRLASYWHVRHKLA